MASNKHPIYSFIPLLETGTKDDPSTASDNINPANTATKIFFVSASIGNGQGAIITKITLAATADLYYPNIASKLVYIYLQQGTTSGSLYYNAAISETTMSVSGTNPVITLEPTGGLLLNPEDSIYLATSQYVDRADGIAYTIEGSYF